MREGVELVGGLEGSRSVRRGAGGPMWSDGKCGRADRSLGYYRIGFGIELG